jgi:hypothetical protein
MAHFAELDENNIVIRIIVVHDNECKDQDGNESEVIGALFCHKLLGGRWIQTSYNNRIRKQYAGVDSVYNADADVFILPQPYPSWTLDKNYDWQPPTPKPTKGFWSWNEQKLSWIQIEEK